VTAPTDALDALFAPRGVAVIGASRDPGKLGAVMARSLARFSGRVAQVNPHDLGMYQSIGAAAADGPVDLAVLCVPAAVSAAALADAAAAGVGAAVVCGGGFAEAGPEGTRHQAALTAVAAETGIRVLGPNTSGFLVPAQRLTASFVPGAAGVPAGRIAVVAASGGVNHAVAFLLTESGHGVSIAVGLGNGADITAPDVLDYLAADPNTAAIGLHVESVAGWSQRCRVSRPRSRWSRSSWAATTSPRSRNRTPVRWRPRGAPPGRPCARPGRCWWTPSVSWSMPSARCRWSGSRSARPAWPC